MAKFDETEGRWITTKGGRHIFIRKENGPFDTGAYERDYDERDVAQYKNLFDKNADSKEVSMHRHDLIRQYQEDARDYLKRHNNQLPNKIDFGESNIQKDAVCTAINSEYKLSPEESKYMGKIKLDYINGRPSLVLGNEPPVSAVGLTDTGIAGMKKLMCAQYARKNDDLIDKQYKEIEEHKKQSDELNASMKESKGDPHEEAIRRKDARWEAFKEDLKSRGRWEEYLKLLRSGARRRIQDMFKNVGYINTVPVNEQPEAIDAFFGAVHDEYKLSAQEARFLDKIETFRKGGKTYLRIPSSKYKNYYYTSVAINDLSDDAVDGVRKLLCANANRDEK